jgi:hypothetical protein
VRPSWRAWAIVAAAGAACTVGDHLHVITGVLSYPHPVFWQEAWWVPLLFAVAALAIVAVTRPIRTTLGGRAEPASVRRVAGDSIAFMAAYAFTAYGHTLPNVVLVVLAAAWLARIVGGAPAWVVIYSLMVAAGGMLFEAGWSKLGFFHYLVPDFIGVPRWLPALYLHVAFLTASIARLVERSSLGVGGE